MVSAGTVVVCPVGTELNRIRKGLIWRGEQEGISRVVFLYDNKPETGDLARLAIHKKYSKSHADRLMSSVSWHSDPLLGYNPVSRKEVAEALYSVIRKYAGASKIALDLTSATQKAEGITILFGLFFGSEIYIVPPAKYKAPPNDETFQLLAKDNGATPEVWLSANPNAPYWDKNIQRLVGLVESAFRSGRNFKRSFVSVNKFIDWLGVQPTMSQKVSIGRALRILENLGFMRRARDGRSTKIALTEFGEILFRAIARDVSIQSTNR